MGEWEEIGTKKSRNWGKGESGKVSNIEWQNVRK